MGALVVILGHAGKNLQLHVEDRRTSVRRIKIIDLGRWGKIMKPLAEDTLNYMSF